MKKILLTLSLIAFMPLTGLFAGKAVVKTTMPDTPYFKAIDNEADPVVGEQYYLRSCVWFNEGDVGYRTSNYREGTLLPINTKVKIVSMDKNKMTLSIVENDKQYPVINETKYSRREMPVILKQMLSKTPISMDGIPQKTADLILAGKMAVGMTKEQIAMARGIPPGIRNRNLTGDKWIYYNSRRTLANIAFSGGIVTKINDKQATAEDEVEL